jgi:hypothetical protein
MPNEGEKSTPQFPTLPSCDHASDRMNFLTLALMPSLLSAYTTTIPERPSSSHTGLVSHELSSNPT